MLPWSVIPTAGIPSRTAAETTSSMREAPSSIEYSVWRCRWTNESGIREVRHRSRDVPFPQRLWTVLWMNHTDVIPHGDDTRTGPREQGLVVWCPGTGPWLVAAEPFGDQYGLIAPDGERLRRPA